MNTSEKKNAWVLDPGIVFWILLIILLFRGLLYTFVIPPWQHPDEPTHFEHVRLIAEQKALPTKEDISIPLRREIAESMARHGFWDPNPPPAITDEALSNPGGSLIGIYTLTHPRLYYIASALWLMPWLHLPVDAQLYVVRMLSVILNLVVVLAVYYMARVLYPTSKWLAIIVAAFVTFQPMHTDIMSAVNNDALINAIGGMFFLVMAWIYQRGLSLVRILLLSLILALGMLTKTTAVVLLAALPLAVLFYIWRSGHLPLFLGILIITFAIVAVGLVLWQLEILQGWVDEVGVWTERYFRVNISGTLDRVQDPTQVKLPLQAAPIVFQSFWAIFGWRHILVDSGVYITIAVITFVALLGLLGLVIRGFMVGENRSSFKDPFPFLVYALSAVLMAWLIAIFRSLADQGMNVYLSHGRYVFIAMAPFALLFTLGLRTWVREPFQRIASFIYLACIILLDSFCFWGYIVPFYY